MTKTPRFTSEELLTIINASPVGMILVNADGNINLSNSKAESIFGYERNEFIKLSVNQLVPDKLCESHEKMRKDFVDRPAPRAMDYGRVLLGKTKSGEEIQLQLGLTPITLSHDHFIMVTVIDITNQILKVASYHDSLTGLANRNLFSELSDNLRNLAIRNKTSLSVLFLDLDGFKVINDDFGHAAGDAVLCQVADILNDSVRKNDIACRIGGDEFLLCFYGVDKISYLNTMANSLIEKISSISLANGDKLGVGVSIGAINVKKPENLTLDKIVSLADKLMYEAKQAGKGLVVSRVVG